jgi:hypothetical protein
MGVVVRAFCVAALIVSSLVVGACGGGSTTTVTTTTAVALQHCTKPDGSGYNYGARVSGISCDQVGRFIRRSIFPRAQQIGEVRRGQTKRIQTGGYACQVVKYTDAPSIGGWRVTCDRGDQHFAFFWTP